MAKSQRGYSPARGNFRFVKRTSFAALPARKGAALQKPLFLLGKNGERGIGNGERRDENRLKNIFSPAEPAATRTPSRGLGGSRRGLREEGRGKSRDEGWGMKDERRVFRHIIYRIYRIEETVRSRAYPPAKGCPRSGCTSRGETPRRGDHCQPLAKTASALRRQ